MEPYKFVESDWASDTTVSNPVTGITLILEGCPIASKSKSQVVISRSATKVESSAATDCTKTALSIRSIMEKIGLEQEIQQLSMKTTQ